MKFLKQLIVFIIVIIALVIFIPRNNQTKTNKNLKEITSYYLTYNNVDIRINNNFQNYLSVLGKYNDERESDSNYPGHIYYYDNFQVETYYDGNVERIKSILFTGDNIYTNEGIGLGDPESYIVNTYNQATVYKDNVYQYVLNDTRLSFIVSKGKIISIEYSMT
jgi:hypothetical protein